MKFKDSTMIGIDIDAYSVRVIEVGKQGRVNKMGQAVFPEGVSETDRSVTLGETMKKALRAARIASGSCAISLGGSDIIMRKFVFPELPEEAMQINVTTEIETYLPEALERYAVGYRIMSKLEQESESAPVQYEVLVVAAPRKSMEDAINAAKKQNLRVMRVDVRENTREKFSQDDRLWKQLASAEAAEEGAVTLSTFSGCEMSYAVLNVGKDSSDVTMYIGGKYYVNRYISSGVRTNLFKKDLFTDQKERPEDSEDQALENLVTEFGSIIDYAYYRERKSKISLVQLFGEAAELQELQDKLWNDLNIASIKPGQLLYEKMPQKLRVQSDLNIHNFLDAYAVTLEPESAEFKDLNLMPQKPKVTKGIRPSFAIAAAAFVLLAVGFLLWFFPNQVLQSNLKKQKETNDQIQQMTQAIENMNVQEKKAYAEEMSKIMVDYDSFIEMYPDTRDMLDAVTQVLGNDVLVYQIRCDNSRIYIYGITTDDIRLIKLITDLRQNDLFVSVSTSAPVISQPPSLRGVLPGSAKFDAEGLYCNFVLDAEFKIVLPVESEDDAVQP